MADTSLENSIEAAAGWILSFDRAAFRGPIIPALKDIFRLSTAQAITAIKRANETRARAS